MAGSKLKTMKECCSSLKQRYIRYTVVKFKNKKFGVLDRNHYNFISQNQLPIARDNFQGILEFGQMSLDKAKKLCKNLNKRVSDTEFEEIK